MQVDNNNERKYKLSVNPEYPDGLDVMRYMATKNAKFLHNFKASQTIRLALQRNAELEYEESIKRIEEEALAAQSPMPEAEITEPVLDAQEELSKRAQELARPSKPVYVPSNNHDYRLAA